jgi:hypothetical protein
VGVFPRKNHADKTIKNKLTLIFIGLIDDVNELFLLSKLAVINVSFPVIIRVSSPFSRR